MISGSDSHGRLWLLIAAVIIIAVSFSAFNADAKNKPTWTDIFSDTMYGGPDGYAIKLIEYDGMIVVGGEFTQIGGELSSIVEANNIAAFDGNGWHSLDMGVTGGDLTRVFALAVYNGDLIVAGNFTLAGSTEARNIARWDGENWYPLAEGIGNESSTGRVFTLLVWNGELYAGGSFTEAGTETANYIAKWNGTTWSPIGNGRPSAVCALCVYDGDLVAGGFNGVGLWNGVGWVPLGLTEDVYALTVYEYEGHERLIAGGQFSYGSGINDLAYYVNNYNWLEFEGGVIHHDDELFTRVQDLKVFNDNLIVTGYFTFAGGSKPAFGIASWNGGWYDLDGGIGREGIGRSILPDEQANCIYLGGTFTNTSTIDTENLGQYIFGKVPPGPPGPTQSSLAGDFTIHPNPFNPVTSIKYSLDAQANVTIEIYDVAGRCVKILMNDRQPAGEHSVSWDGKDNLGNTVTSGVYFARLAIGDPGGQAIETRKLILLR